MKPELQRIKIAEACGWKKLKGFSDSGWPLLLTPPKNPNTEGYLEAIPDYLNSLDAMHEVVMVKAGDRHFVQKYCKQLRKVVGSAEWASFAVENATASQRAEAFLRTLNLWQE